MPIDVIVADRCPAAEGATRGGSMVSLIRQGLATAPASRHTVWISPASGDSGSDWTSADGSLAVKRVGVPGPQHDDYYLTVGAGRLWMALHGIPDQFGDDALSDLPWRRFFDVNHAVAAEVVATAPAGSRVTVHDYTLLLAAQEIVRQRPDLSLVYVHHTPWPHVTDAMPRVTRDLLQVLAGAAASCGAVCVSSQRCRQNLESWTPAKHVIVAHPGVDVEKLRAQMSEPALDGCWTPVLADPGRRPVIASVGRPDPSKNLDTLLCAWAALVADGVHGTLCLHLIPTSRGAVKAYRLLREQLLATADEIRRLRPDSILVICREAQDDALQLLQQADVVVACSRADGWNLVAAEACALGPDSQCLVLSAQTGAAEVLAPVARIVSDPLDQKELERCLRAAIDSGPRPQARRRTGIPLPTPDRWWSMIMDAHDLAMA